MRWLKIFGLFIILMATTITPYSYAADEEPVEHLSYYGFQPDIITNYIKRGKTLGYVRVSVEIMVSTESDLDVVSDHDPLLRDAIIQIFGRQEEQKVKSLTGREEIRNQCLEAVNELLVREAGAKVAKDLLFTKYIYQ